MNISLLKIQPKILCRLKIHIFQFLAKHAPNIACMYYTLLQNEQLKRNAFHAEKEKPNRKTTSQLTNWGAKKNFVVKFILLFYGSDC